METLSIQSSPNRLRLVKSISALSMTALFAACASGQYEIKANHVVEIISEDESQRYITPQEGGYPHYEEMYGFTVQQCDREDLPMANENGCVIFNMTVSKQEFQDFDPGDRIVFQSQRSGRPLDPSE